jgi:hypothetical protein
MKQTCAQRLLDRLFCSSGGSATADAVCFARASLTTYVEHPKAIEVVAILGMTA